MLINIVVCVGLVLGGVSAMFSGSFVVGIALVLAVIPVGIYFRVVMMRRCRDIGWTPALPWILFGVGIVANLITLLGGSSPAEAFTMMTLPVLVGLADFTVMIVIGCIGSKDGAGSIDYQRVFGDDPDELRHLAQAGIQAPPADEETARWDDAIKRALAKQAAGGQELQAAGSSASTAPPAPARPQPAGFGRKGL
jgi:uncharacterized membrane protein YhaH (DUF805 family)